MKLSKWEKCDMVFHIVETTFQIIILALQIALFIKK